MRVLTVPAVCYNLFKLCYTKLRNTKVSKVHNLFILRNDQLQFPWKSLSFKKTYKINFKSFKDIVKTSSMYIIMFKRE